MKSVTVTVGIAAALAVVSVGFAAHAQGITRAECEANALMAYNAGVQRCSSWAWYTRPVCLGYESQLYNQQLAYCRTLAIPATPTKPDLWDGWFGF